MDSVCPLDHHHHHHHHHRHHHRHHPLFQLPVHHVARLMGKGSEVLNGDWH